MIRPNNLNIYPERGYFCVVTTINPPTEAIKILSEKFEGNLIVIGDNKTPKDWAHDGARFYSKEIQDQLDLTLKMPENHYARKNFGYLVAIKAKASLIYDSDDDNIPNEKWRIRKLEHNAYPVTQKGWCNIYDFFSDEHCWPRGFSLRHVKDSYPVFEDAMNVSSPIQQGLADGEADVDAIYRLTGSEQSSFEMERSVYLNSGVWCPFNSQSTWWFPLAYPLMYLPVYATFRMTDIWRSFVAQRCIWELGYGITFHSPSEVYQKRNEHDLLKDLEDEVPGYLNNDKIVETLNNLILQPGAHYITHNLLACYQALVQIGVLPPEEIDSVKAWIHDINN